MKNHPPQLDPAEFNTILAALRFYQAKGMGEPSNRPDWLHMIATDCDNDISLDSAGITDLCERLNTSTLTLTHA
jgi:hypothetical protein